ncbi:hypothetical protein COCSUDRAFT_41776 [Coccomyxa subellipsoidea C-169]|uniref:Uncharacterized protein n=1 Tax=Coccomyxa subellipsoidea (strain C-169) TaxID=574566 RepID=I0YYV8_COCSC|nr:hypothetical protein COCSUDRAFT_41776 [Coccomyxa subellipsoidea C-169]EIE23577.1 hypothetical protein COCSUDRAFT_41776 [Coccomyxa subellipsoidea C-169]|eukprot:XP_005648121.1 hypothetical protein COCSUDRAFT_41776 [Coccomyxa subellipsoidea C-169]
MRDHVGEARVPLLGSPGNKLRIALGLSPSPPRSPSQQQHSHRAVSTTIFRTCAAIAGLVIINAILAGVILSAVHSFGGSSNKPVKLDGLHNTSPGYSNSARTEPSANSALTQPAAALYSPEYEGYNSTVGKGKPPWWPRAFGADDTSTKKTSTQQARTDRDVAAASSARQADKLAKEQGAQASGTGIQPQQGSQELALNTSWVEKVDNSSWVTQVEEFFMEDDSTEEAATPAAPALRANATAPAALIAPAPAPAPGRHPETADTATSADLKRQSADPSRINASAVAASPAPASDSEAAPRTKALDAADAGGKDVVSEATLAWERLAEARVEEAPDAVQQEAVIEQEKAASDGSEVEAFGEVYSAGDVAGTMVDGAQNATAAAPAPAPSPQHAPDPCAAALGIPKVAIMFLSRAELLHESSWALWFQHAAGLLPASALRAPELEGCTSKHGYQIADEDGGAGCDAGRVRLAQQWCSPEAQGNGVLQRQHLFSVYIHPLPNYGTFPEESIFRGQEIEDRIQALRDPLNQKFAMLSESGVPLYPPTAVYAQLMAEDKSRIDSCGSGRTDPWRFSGRMGWALRNHWRKSSQWFALSRKHAEIVLDDTYILDLFQRYCQNAWDNDLNRWRDCFSDEHYMPSLIAYKQLGHETDCVGRLVGVDWSLGGAHPRSYTAQDINPDKMASLRLWDDTCDDQEAMRLSADQFVHEANLGRLGSSRGVCSLPSYNGSALSYDCPLFARKFPRETASAVYNLFRSCTTGLNITNSGLCAEGAADILDQRVSNEHLSRRELREGVRKMLGRRAESVSASWEEPGWL